MVQCVDTLVPQASGHYLPYFDPRQRRLLRLLVVELDGYSILEICNDYGWIQHYLAAVFVLFGAFAGVAAAAIVAHVVAVVAMVLAVASTDSTLAFVTA